MNERFVEGMRDSRVRHDIAVLGDFTRVYCRGNHRERQRTRCTTDAAKLGAYGHKPPLVCEECESHLAYAEQRRAACSRDPKPFCAHCDTQCYREIELEWQRNMMRYSGPKSWYRGHFIDSIKHAAEAIKYRRTSAASAVHQTSD